jgi:hypothetical protein
MTRHITLVKKWPERYFSSLSKPVQFMRERELLKRKRTGQFKLGKSDTFAKPHKSKWTLQFHKVYPGLKFNKNAISAKTGISRQVLNTVYNRGRRAWQTGGSRPGMTADQWGVARVYKFVLVSKKKAPVSWYKNKSDPNKNLRSK